LAKRADANQPEIVKELEKMGCSVLHLHMVGKGCPDLAVALRGRTYLVEIKNGERYWEMSPAQDKFRLMWNAPVILIDSVESATNWVQKLTES
jgi:hypothetical protein